MVANYTIDIYYDKDLDNTVIEVYNGKQRVVKAIKGNLLCLEKDGEMHRAKRQAIEEFQYGK